MPSFKIAAIPAKTRKCAFLKKKESEYFYERRKKKAQVLQPRVSHAQQKT